MLGGVFTLIFCAGIVGLTSRLARRWLENLDPAAQLGIAGLIGLGCVGLLTLPIGLIPGGLNWGLFIVLLLSAAGWICFFTSLKFSKPALPQGAELLGLLTMVAATLQAFVSAVTPSDSVDWDTLAYHLAVPKIWLTQGQIRPITYIHHSNFPGSVDYLYIWGLKWGNEYGAKTFEVAFFILGALIVFGLTRGRYGSKAAWLALAAFATIPMSIWEAGTAYIDLSNGLFGGVAILLAAKCFQDRRFGSDGILAAILVGFCAGSKYTGLMTVGILTFMLAVGLAHSKSKFAGVKPALAFATIAFAICGSWYAKNIAWTGNPVYPFYYALFGGKNWSAYNGKIYSQEQRTFGTGRRVPKNPGESISSMPVELERIGGAILGLSYQPGRFTNPDPVQGLGFPFVALGGVVLFACLVWAFAGRPPRFETFLLSAVIAHLLIWFKLSEQSRYLLWIAAPASLLAGGAIAKLRVKQLMVAAVAAQAITSLSLIFLAVTSLRLDVLYGKVTKEKFMDDRISFYKPSVYLNQVAKGGRVALYDEVFGFLLNVPYLWANPGHSTEMGYEKMRTSADLMAAFKREGITYVYINLGLTEPNRAAIVRWMKAAALIQPARPYSAEKRAEMMSDLRSSYVPLLAEASARRQIVAIKAYGPRVIFRVANP